MSIFLLQLIVSCLYAIEPEELLFVSMRCLDQIVGRCAKMQRCSMSSALRWLVWACGWCTMVYGGLQVYNGLRSSTKFYNGLRRFTMVHDGLWFSTKVYYGLRRYTMVSEGSQWSMMGYESRRMFTMEVYDGLGRFAMVYEGLLLRLWSLYMQRFMMVYDTIPDLRCLMRGCELKLN